MSFSYTVDGGDYSIGKHLRYGTYNCSGVTTGDIKTGLRKVLHFSDMPATTSPSTVAVLSAGTVTLTTTSGQTGTWLAIGD